jgi:DNA-binding CsgD family transcriptional regulator
MLTEEFLKDLSKQHYLSDSEADVLSRTLKDMSIDAIAADLSITQNAVRKRLGEVYDKLGVSGRGPGKLAKLQQILSAHHQAQERKQVLIWWSGLDGKRIAETLKNTIFSYPQLETKVCSIDPVVSKAWRTEVELNLKNLDIAIGCLTPGSSQNLGVNYAAGFLTAQTGIRSQLIRFGESLNEPLIHLSSIDGTKLEELARLLQEVKNININEAQKWVEFNFPKLDEEIGKKSSYPVENNQAKLVQTIDSIKSAGNYLKANQYVIKNICFQQIILNSVTEIHNQLLAVDSDYYIPGVLYPQRLISLQRLDARVIAIALVGHQEHFWSGAVAREIVNTAHQENTRVFVFTKPEDFDRNFEMLLEHTKY